MKVNVKVQIYQGMIQYLLESTNYSLKDIAELSRTSTKNIRLIYCHDVIPRNFESELHIVRLYQTILEFQKNFIAPYNHFKSGQNR